MMQAEPMPTVQTKRYINFICIALLTLIIAIAWQQPALWETFGIKMMRPEGCEDALVIGTGIETHEAGGLAQHPNPTDPWKRPMNYPSVWLLLGVLGVDSTHATGLSVAFALIFLAGLIICAFHRDLASFPCALLALSPAVMLGIERGNNDLVIFGGLVFAVALRARHPRSASILWVVLCVLKLYPLLAAPAFVPHIRRGLLTLLVIFVASYLFIIRDEIRAIMDLTPVFPLNSFGARTIVRQWDRYLLPGREIIVPLCTALLAVPLCLVRPLHCLRLRTDVASGLFLAGGTLTSIGYIVLSSFDYRLMFCILCVPFLAGEWLRDGSRRHLAALASIAIAMTMVATEAALYRAGVQPVDFIPFTQALRWMMFLTLAPLVLEQLFAATGTTLDRFLHPEEHA